MFRHTLLASALLAASFTSSAHVSLEIATAKAGSTYKGVFRVTHGCVGSATQAVTVFLPAGVVGAKPMPKAGWKTEVATEKLAQPYLSHGKPVDTRASQITWRGGLLQDHEFDEFVIRMNLPERAGKLWFRVLQQCEKGENNWAVIPQTGQARPEFPAVGLDVIPATPEHHHH